ncbi:MAG: response regulator transcription factor [Phycisphaerae bacterium]|nr:response regulator transcription factor [Phycisphaerae bacterium]
MKPSSDEAAPLVSPTISVLCADDNQHVADAMKITFERAGGFAWTGWLPGADTVIETVLRDRTSIVILDIDMPGRNPFDVIEELSDKCPWCRAVMFSGHVRYELIERAFVAGAWGYVSKNDGEAALMQAVRDVCRDELAMSLEVRAVYGR